MGLVFYIFNTVLLSSLYVLPVLLIRFLLGRPINRGSALALSFIAFIAYTIVHLMLWKVAHRSVQLIIHGFLISSIPLINDRPTVALRFSFSVPSSISVSNSRTIPFMDPLAAE